MNLHENELVIEAFELFEQAVNEGEGIVVCSFDHIESYETGFEVLTEEASSFAGGPLDARLCDADLDIGGVGDVVEKVKQLSYYDIGG